MTWSQLRTFLAVAETGSARGAANRLSVTQSAVSAALAALQRDLGAPLVMKDGRGLALTPAGHTYAQYARQVLGLLEEGRAAALGGNDPSRGKVRIAAVTTVGEHVLPPLLASFRQRYPAVGLLLEVGTRARVWELAANHECDIVISGRPPSGVPGDTRAVRPNELIVVTAAQLPHSDPLRTTWLLRENGSGTRDTTEALLEWLDIDPPRLTLGSNGAVIAGAVAGLGVTLMSRVAIQRELDSGLLRPVPVAGTPLSRPWHVVTQPHSTGTTELLLAHLLEASGDPGFNLPEALPGQAVPSP